MLNALLTDRGPERGEEQARHSLRQPGTDVVDRSVAREYPPPVDRELCTDGTPRGRHPRLY
jgi:hypothetical protein